MLKHFIFVSLLWFAQYSAAENQTQIVMGVSEIPYLLSMNNDKAVAYNPVLAELKTKNKALKFFFMTPARAEIMFDNRYFQCLFPASKTTIPNSERLIQSAALTSVEAYIFSKVKYADHQFFENKIIAIRRGFSYGNFRDVLQAKYIELEDDQATLQFLLKGRADALIGYLPDIIGAQKLLNIAPDTLFYHKPIYIAEEAIVCHDSATNRAFINKANVTFNRWHERLK